MSKSIKLVVRGGLGNQIHQFAIANSLAQKQGKKIELDARHLPSRQQQNRTGVTIYPFLLSDFEGFAAPVQASNNLVSRYLFRLLVEIRRRALGFRVLAKMFNRTVVDESLDRLTLESRVPRVIISLMAAIKLTPNEISSVQDNLGQPKYPSQVYKSLSIELNRHKTIGVHIRRGDYVNLAHIYGYISDEWYLTQVRRLAPFHEKILIFTDAEGCEANFSGEFGRTVVQVIGKNELNGAVEVLSLLSRCNSLVLSNSSFSRWAVGLSNKVETVICPLIPAGLKSAYSITELGEISSARIVAEPIY